MITPLMLLLKEQLHTG